MKIKYLLNITILLISSSFFGQVPSGFVKDKFMSDEFNYPSKNASFKYKWNDFNDAGWSGPGATLFKRENVVLNGSGKLIIKASYFSGGELNTDDPDPDGNFFKRSVHTGYVSMKNPIRPPVYFEASMKANNLNTASSFWAKLGAGKKGRNNYTEIDVVEMYSTKGNANNNFHIFGVGGKADYSSQRSPFLSNRTHIDFNTYGCYWVSRDELYFYVNGKQVRHIYPCAPNPRDRIDHPGNTKTVKYLLEDNMRIIFDTEAHVWKKVGSEPSKAALENIRKQEEATVDRNLKYKNQMQVDWVRVYKPRASTKIMKGCESKTASFGTTSWNTSYVKGGYINKADERILSVKRGGDIKASFDHGGTAVISLRDKNNRWKVYGQTSKRVNKGDRNVNFYVKFNDRIPSYGTDLVWQLKLNGKWVDSKPVTFVSGYNSSWSTSYVKGGYINKADERILSVKKGSDIKASFDHGGTAVVSLRDKNNRWKVYGQTSKRVNKGDRNVNFYVKFNDRIPSYGTDLVWQLKLNGRWVDSKSVTFINHRASIVLANQNKELKWMGEKNKVLTTVLRIKQNPIYENNVEVLGLVSKNVRVYTCTGILIPCEVSSGSSYNSVLVTFKNRIDSGVYILQTANGESIQFIKADR